MIPVHLDLIGYRHRTRAPVNAQPGMCTGRVLLDAYRTPLVPGWVDRGEVSAQLPADAMEILNPRADEKLDDRSRYSLR